MKELNLVLIVMFLLICSTGNAQRSKENFGSDWEFKCEEPGARWEKINLPHTARLEDLVVVTQFQGTSIYKKSFRIGRVKDKNVFIYFEGVMQDAEVFINGGKVLNHKGGYLPFTVDATDFLKANSENAIELLVKNVDDAEIPPGKPIKDLDFNYYGGIYRNVFLITTSKLHITDAVHANKTASGGLFINFDSISKSFATGTVKVHLKNDFAERRKASLRITVLNGKQKLKTTTAEFIVDANSDKEVTHKIEIPNPKLWSVANPNLYDVKVEVMSGEKIIDSFTETTGIRKAEVRADGFYLNGEKLFIAGTNRHQEYPYVGYAISDAAQWRDAVKIKNAGFDFVRLSHYPQAEAFLAACDKLGLIVMNSIPGWQFFGNATFQDRAVDAAREMARRDRNRPSVIFWEVSLNESEMTTDFMNRITKALKEELPARDNISVGWMDDPAYDVYIPARQHGKAPDYWTKYSNGSRKIFIAEYGDWEYYAQNAGFNQTEFANLKEDERTSRQLRAFGEKRLLQQAFNFQEASNSNRKGDATIGEANWLMFDYNRGYSPDIESSGISDIFRIPKFAYYFYQSQRSPDEPVAKPATSGPMVHIASHWNEESSQKVTVFSNCDQVELYLNDNLIARQAPSTTEASNSLKHPPFIFDLQKFSAGTLKARAFLNGKQVAEHSVTTATKATSLRLRADLSSIKISQNTPDVIFIYAEITDATGNLVHSATNQTIFESSGGQLIGNPISAEAGIATVLLRTEKFTKPVTITVKSPGLKPATITLKP